MLQNRQIYGTKLLSGVIFATVLSLSVWLWHTEGHHTGELPTGEQERAQNVLTEPRSVRQSGRQNSPVTAVGDFDRRSSRNQPGSSPAQSSLPNRETAPSNAETLRREEAGTRAGDLPAVYDFPSNDRTARADPASDPGQQSAIRIPLSADPGVAHLRVAEAERDVDVRSMPAAKLAEEYGRLSTVQEKEEYLAELMASNRSNAASILSDLFAAENDPSVKESILSAAAEAGQGAELQALLAAAMNPAQPVDVRLAALYYASDNVPELVGQFVNDPNLDVREEAQNLVEAQATKQ